MPNLETLFAHPFPDNADTISIQLADDAPPADYDAAFYQKKFKSTFAHGVFYYPCYEPLVQALKQEIAGREVSPEEAEINAKVAAFMKNPVDYFTIRCVDEEHGSITTVARRAPKGTITGIYNGIMTFTKKYSHDKGDTAYRARIGWFRLQGEEYSVSIDAKDQGDATRFLPDLPHRKAKLPALDTAIKPHNILRANISFSTAVYEGFPIIYQIAEDDMEIGDVAGECYGDNYWAKRGINPSLFVKNGENQVVIATYDTDQKKYVLNPHRFFHLKPPGKTAAAAKVAHTEVAAAKESAPHSAAGAGTGTVVDNLPVSDSTKLAALAIAAANAAGKDNPVANPRVTPPPAAAPTPVPVKNPPIKNHRIRQVVQIATIHQAIKTAAAPAATAAPSSPPKRGFSCCGF